MKFLPSVLQKVSSEQTDRQTLMKLLPITYADDNKEIACMGVIKCNDLLYSLKIHCNLVPKSFFSN